MLFERLVQVRIFRNSLRSGYQRKPTMAKNRPPMRARKTPIADNPVPGPNVTEQFNKLTNHVAFLFVEKLVRCIETQRNWRGIFELE